MLKDDLQDLVFPRKSVRIQYVDDLLIVSKTKTDCIWDTQYLCGQLVKKGHRVSPPKLQLCQKNSPILYFCLSPGRRETDPERTKGIQKLPRPTTKRQPKGFLGQVGFGRPWPWCRGFSEIAKPLHQATRKEEIEAIAWGPERQKAFRNLKSALLNAPALPGYTKPFQFYCGETKGIAKGALVQTWGLYQRPLACFSASLGSAIKGTPLCVGAIAAAAAAAETVEKSRSIVLGHALTAR